MSVTYQQAVDDMLGMLKSAWDPTGHKMFWENDRDDRETDLSPWAAVIVRHATGQQDTLGGKGSREFLRLGTIMVMINTPSSSGLSNGYVLAKVVTDAFEGETSPNGVWFRDVRINEIGREGTFYKTNALIDFEYYETK